MSTIHGIDAAPVGPTTTHTKQHIIKANHHKISDPHNFDDHTLYGVPITTNTITNNTTHKTPLIQSNEHISVGVSHTLQQLADNTSSSSLPLHTLNMANNNTELVSNTIHNATILKNNDHAITTTISNNNTHNTDPDSSSSSSSSTSSLSSSSSSSPSISSLPSRIATIQRAFDIFTMLDTDNKRVLDINQVQHAMSLFTNNPNTFTYDEVEQIVKVASSNNTDTLLFSEFYAIFACLTLIRNKFDSSGTHLTRSQVKSALLEAGLDPTSTQLQHMFNVKASDQHILPQDTEISTTTSTSPLDIMDVEDNHLIDFVQILSIYLAAPRSEGDLFLHSWYREGRTNFLLHKKHIEASPMQDFVAGTAAGVALTLVGHPFDTVKVRMQTSKLFTSAINCVGSTIKNEGIFALYKGMTGPMLTIPAINAIVFTCYAAAQKFFAPYFGEGSYTTITLAGMYAGAMSCMIACPVELIKTRLQIQYGTDKNAVPFAGPIDCIKAILRTSGTKGLFRGMAATLYREIPGYGAQFFCYEWIKGQFMKRGDRREFELSAFELLSAGGIAGTMAWLASYPMDYIKSQIQAEPWNKKTKFQKNPYLFDGGFFSALRYTLRTKGFLELWRGLSVCLTRGFPANAVGFLAYEQVLALLREKRLLTGKPSSSH